MALAKVTFAPGINKEGTQYSAGPTWYDCDKVRFRQGLPEKIGGWAKYSGDAIKGVTRSLFDWSTSGAQNYLGIGTNLKFYVEQGSLYFDITPIRETTAAGDATFAAVDGDATLTVTEASHGASVGDFVTFSGAASLGGNIVAAVINHEYQIASIIDGNDYTVEATDAAGVTVTANAFDTGDSGASTVAEYQIQIGTNNYVGSTGYGVGNWGSAPWGGGGALSFAGQLRLYSQDKFANDLIFNPRGGSVFFWDESGGTGTRAVDLSTLGGASDTPTVALQVMVSSVDRHVICFGVNPLGSGNLDPLLVRWSTQESAAIWTPTSTNTAGGQVLSGGKAIVGAVKARQEILIFTETTIHSMRYAGAPFVYQFSVLSENVSCLSPKGMVTVGDMVYFISLKGFYVYRGAVQPLTCPVFDYVFSNIDRGQLYKVFATSNTDNYEVTWFYPSGGPDAEITNYVTFNYKEQVWSVGTMVRGAWIEANTKSYPIAASADTANIDTNYLYNQEFGYDADGVEILPHIESGSLSIADGEQFAFMKRVIPDFRWKGMEENADLTISIKGNDFPLEDETTRATGAVTNTTKQNHVRVRAREVVLRIDGEGLGYGWTMGDFRFDMRTDGRR